MEMILQLPELITANDFLRIEKNNRYGAGKVKKDLTETVAWEAKKLKPIKKISKLTIIWKEINKRRDPDNVAFGIKFILDGLQQAGIIENDGWGLWKNEPKIIHKFELADKRGCLVLIKYKEDL